MASIVDAIETFNDEIYWAVRGTGLYRTSTARTFVKAARLVDARFDAYMKAVDKKWIDVTLKLKAALTGDQELKLYASCSGGARYVTQPPMITGVQILDIADATTVGSKALAYVYDDTTLAFAGGTPVDVSAGGYFTISGASGSIRVFVEADLLPSVDYSDTVTVAANPVLLFTMTASDGSEKLAVFPTDMITKYITLTLDFSQDSSDSDVVIEHLFVKHMPIGDTKMEWGFVIEAYEDMLLLDDVATTQSKEPRTGLEIKDDLMELYLTRKPVVMEDIDGRKYRVMVTSVNPVGPSIGRPSPKLLEYDFAIELTEV